MPAVIRCLRVSQSPTASSALSQTVRVIIGGSARVGLNMAEVGNARGYSSSLNAESPSLPSTS